MYSVQQWPLNGKNPCIYSKDSKEFIDSHASGSRAAVGGQRAIGALHLCQPERTETQINMTVSYCLLALKECSIWICVAMRLGYDQAGLYTCIG